ncbi:MAG: hypothetical protein KDJ16_04045 [Hyphomicrobiales bacterium]|nr:hypothetical protein [Hyphomicrobiales bacterium]
MLLPDVAHLAQHVGGVMVARRRLHAQRMEFLRFRELVGNLGEPRNDAAAIAEHRDGAALPVAEPIFVGMLELTKQVVDHAAIAVAFIAQRLQAGDKARPRTALQVVEQRCVVNLHIALFSRIPGYRADVVRH